MTISIIIPTYNEADNIAKLVHYLNQHKTHHVVDIIVSDGGSTDSTLAQAEKAGAKAIISAGKGRAAQMNYGAQIAKGAIFYFVHADSFPPASFVKDIMDAVHNGYYLGRYRTRFDSNKTILKINAWFTRFDLFICMGGDQTLFIKRSLFEQCAGFKEDMRIMEEYDLCQRARLKGKYKIMKGSALISARKYETNSWLNVQLANYKVVQMYKKGAPQEALVKAYKEMLQYRKSAF
jgi:rSAM/selenodomain-associated transferase 2